MTFIFDAFVQCGLVMIMNRGRRHSVIDCFSPVVQPIVVLELALGESLLWKCHMSTFMFFLTMFAHYMLQLSM